MSLYKQNINSNQAVIRDLVCGQSVCGRVPLYTQVHLSLLELLCQQVANIPSRVILSKNSNQQKIHVLMITDMLSYDPPVLAA